MDFYDPIQNMFKKKFPPIYKLKPLFINGVEVTQAIQYYHSSEHLTDSADQGADNSVRLIAGKPAWARVYVRHELYSGDIAGVTGTLEVFRRFNGITYTSLGTLSPQPPGSVTACLDPAYSTERGTLGSSLNFIIPAAMMLGHLKLVVRVSAPSGATDDHELLISATLRQTLRLRGIMVGYNGPTSQAPNAPNLTLPAPTLADLQATSAWTLRTFPVQSTAVYSSAGVILWTKPLTDAPSCPGCCTPNWDALIAALQAQKVADGNKTDVLYYGLLPETIPMGNIIGCSGGGMSSGKRGEGVTMAHELGHACGLPHAPCGVPGDPYYPVYEPYDSGGIAKASIGEYGLDISDGTIMSPSLFKDWMSYCAHPWISLYNYTGLLNNAALDPHIVGEDILWNIDEYEEYYDLTWPPKPIPALRRKFVITDPDPIVSIIGIMRPDDQVEVTSVMRLRAIPQVIGGQETGLRAELVGAERRVLASAPVFRLPLLGSGCGCGCSGGAAVAQPASAPYVFQIFLSDVEPGEALRIRRGETVLWNRAAPATRQRAPSLRVELGEGRALIARYKAAEEAECWLQWSADGGASWHALATQLGRNGASLANPDLPSGRLLVRLLTSNGFHTAVSTAVELQVPERPPLVSILVPRDRHRLVAGQPMWLLGVASAYDGGEARFERAVWLLDDREVAEGLDAFIPAPPQGEHRLTLVVLGPGESRAETSVGVRSYELPTAE